MVKLGAGEHRLQQSCFASACCAEWSAAFASGLLKPVLANLLIILRSIRMQVMTASCEQHVRLKCRIFTSSLPVPHQLCHGR